MNEKRVRGILIGSALMLGGVAMYGVHRKKKSAYIAVQNKIRGIAVGTGAGYNLDSSTFNAQQISKALYDAGEGRWGTDEQEIFAILERIADSPNPQGVWIQVVNAYQSKYNRQLVGDLRDEMSGSDLTKLTTLLARLS